MERYLIIGNYHDEFSLIDTREVIVIGKFPLIASAQAHKNMLEKNDSVVIEEAVRQVA